jgi:hypothetical protein
MTTATPVRPKPGPADPFAKPRLSPEQTAAYRQQGYLLYDQPVFPAAKFEALKSHFEQLLAHWLADPRMRSPEHMDVPHFLDPELFRWLLDDDVLNLVEPILGPDLALFSSHFICKPAGKGKRVPWHEDSSYWKGRLDPMEVVTVWLAIDPSTPANGCMRVIPATHHTGRAGFSDYEPQPDADRLVFGTEIRRDQLDEAHAVDCILAPGQASLHDGRIIHGSAPNLGATRRCGYTMRYISTATKFLDDAHGPFRIYLARGRDHAGNRYGDPGKPNAAWLEANKDGWPAGH